MCLRLSLLQQCLPQKRNAITMINKNNVKTDIILSNEAGLCPLPFSIRHLTKLLESLLEGSDLEALTLHLVRDARIMELNSTHMHCQSPTNILSFPAAPSMPRAAAALPAMPHILVLSVDTWRRESILYGQDPLEYLIHLLAHGIGHLMGFDHGEAMWACCHVLEDRGKAYMARVQDIL